MKHLTILVPVGQHNLSSLVGAYKIFNRAEQHWRSLDKPPVFDIQVAGTAADIDFHQGLFTVHPHTHIDQIRETDLVVIPALARNFTQGIAENQALISWVREQYKIGAEVASICTGAFLLASTGLLDGRNCSTHWLATNVFRQMFPKITLVPDKIITDEYGIYTSGGAYSFLNLILYLVEKYYDRQTALFCAKVFEIDIDRNCQSPFTVFLGQKDHQDEMIKKAQSYIENNAHDKVSVEDLASRFAVGRRNFDRRFKKATGNTPIEYLQRVKIEAAKKGLENTRKTIQEVMFDVGYSDVKAFRNIFKKITGLSPLEYRNKYNKEALLLE